MDPLSDVLSLLKPRSCVAGGFGATDHLAIQFPNYQGIKCYAVVAGQCWLSVDNVADPVLLTAGDCFLLPRGWPFSLATDLSIKPVDFHILLADMQNARANAHIALHEDGASCYIVGGYFRLDGDHAEVLLGSLPPIVHIRKDADKAAMRWSLERMREEVRDPQPGGSLIAQQLAYVMLVQALRLHLAEGVKGGVGWLFALADKQMRAAITSMHEEPAHQWTLQELAARAGMSRSIFALKFKQTVGTTPMEYLTRWRMMLAADRLKESGDTIYAIASALGYESESAFGKAFKRVMGLSPRQYGRGRSLPSAVESEETARAERLQTVAAD